MFELIDTILSILQAEEDLVLATIIGDRGSTPRTAGSKMIVRKDGTIDGTIGGGSVEGDVIAYATKMLVSGGAEILDFDLGLSSHTEQMDLICGGRMQVLLEFIQANDVNVGLYLRMSDEVKKTEPFFWLGQISGDEGKCFVQRAIVSGGKILHGEVKLPSRVEEKLVDLRDKSSTATVYFEEGSDHYVVELIQPPATLILVGGGHVSLEIAHLAKISGFTVMVMDDRIEFANEDRFPEADKVLICPEYNDVFSRLEVSRSSYIVIVTRGHHFDMKVLTQALQTDSCYIGMIGSRRKRETIYNKLIDQGVKREDLEQVHCPIGLAIDAETPVEIGISVVAQLIKHRAGQKRNEAR